jgi:hypothetical protein
MNHPLIRERREIGGASDQRHSGARFDIGFEVPAEAGTPNLSAVPHPRQKLKFVGNQEM